MKILTKILLIVSAALILTGCNKEDSQESDVIVLDDLTKEEEEDTEVEIEEEDVYEDVIPEGMYRSELTNELIDISLQDQRPIAVMVDNEKFALPHYGVSEADVVYEMMNSTDNNRITRLMVLVKDWAQVGQLGSIRSTRPTNCILAAGWNAILCHEGGSSTVNEYLSQPYSSNFGGSFSRVDNGKAYEFTEYILAGDIEKKFANTTSVSQSYTETYGGQHFQFVSEEKPIYHEEGISVSEIQMPYAYNKSVLTYNEETQLYEYSVFGEPHLDPGNDNARLTFKNVIIQECSFVPLSSGVVEFNVVGQGNLGYYITNGSAIPISWEKGSEAETTKYYHLETGEEITLNTGKTYIGIVANDNWEDLVLVE